jgi:hypothetical protein
MRAPEDASKAGSGGLARFLKFDISPAHAAEFEKAVEELQQIIERKDAILKSAIPNHAQAFQKLIVDIINEDAIAFAVFASKVSLGPLRILRLDHTFRLGSSVRIDGEAPFAAVCSVTNEYGEVLAQSFVFDLSTKAITPMLEALAKRLVAQDPSLKHKMSVLYIDNCCSHRAGFTKALQPLNIIVKLDLYHWIKRFTAAMQFERHACGVEFLSQIRGIIWKKNESLGFVTIRPHEELRREIEALRDSLVGRQLFELYGQEFDDMLKRQMSHLPCIEDPPFTEAELRQIQRGSNEGYHHLLNHFVKVSGASSVDSTAASLAQFNFNIYFQRMFKRLEAEHRDLGVRDPGLLSSLLASCTTVFAEAERLGFCTSEFRDQMKGFKRYDLAASIVVQKGDEEDFTNLCNDLPSSLSAMFNLNMRPPGNPPVPPREIHDVLRSECFSTLNVIWDLTNTFEIIQSGITASRFAVPMETMEDAITGAFYGAKDTDLSAEAKEHKKALHERMISTPSQTFEEWLCTAPTAASPNSSREISALCALAGLRWGSCGFGLEGATASPEERAKKLLAGITTSDVTLDVAKAITALLRGYSISNGVLVVLFIPVRTVNAFTGPTALVFYPHMATRINAVVGLSLTPEALVISFLPRGKNPAKVDETNE